MAVNVKQDHKHCSNLEDSKIGIFLMNRNKTYLSPKCLAINRETSQYM